MRRLSFHSASCSCTSCVYRSRSKQPSVQQLLADGSKIDKLYYGKYLPLRERKLLEKLIRTRAVYDDVRSQLISTSGSSDQTRSEHKIKRREDDSTEKSSAVLKIVDLVDRGHIGTSNTSKLSSCCSCCSCSSLRKIKKRMEKHPRVHRHHVPYEAIARYTVEAEKRGRRRRRQLSTKISSKIRAVHFKMKSIRSEPCTCTLSLSSVMTRPSKAFMKKVRSKEMAIEDAEAQKAAKVERYALRRKLCSCSCKIAKLPMKSIRKIKNIRPSMTKESGTDMIDQKKFRVKKDSLTLFREKLLRKRELKDWECGPGICVKDECIPEECLVKKTRGVGERRRRRVHSRHSGSGRDHRYRISMSTRPKKVKVTDSRVQAIPKSNLGPVTCECKPATKSESSMTAFSKSKSFTEMISSKGEFQVKRPKSPTHKPRGILKETAIQERTYKSYPPKRTESFVYRDKEQALPETKMGSVVCECKPAAKSSYSMTTILKKQTMHSVSKSELTVKRPLTLKPRTQFEKKEMYKQEKLHTTGRPEREFRQVSPKSNRGHAICECKPITKSITSMTSISKSSKSPPRTVKPKPKPQLVIKEVIIEEKAMKQKAKPQLVLKEMVLEEKAIKTSHENDKEQVSSKSKLSHALCECKPSTKSLSSMTTISKPQTLKSWSKTIKSKARPQLVITETVVQQKAVYKTGGPKQHKKETSKTRDKKPVKSPPKSKLSHVTCECKPSSKSSFSMTSVAKPKSEVKDKVRSPKFFKQEKPYIMIRHKPRRVPHKYYEIPHQVSEGPESEKQAVKISSSFKFEIEFSKKRHPALTNRELIKHVQAKRARRMKPTRSRPQYRKYQHSKTQVTGGLPKTSQDSQISYLRTSSSQASKPYRGSILPFPRECEPLMCIPYECDPKNCARILLSRSKSRGRSAKSSTVRLRRKSVGSTTFSQKTNSKSKHIQSKSTETFTRRPKSVLSNPPPQIIERNIGAENSNPHRQAVRISSNFSFDIQFYKDTPPGLKTDGAQDFSPKPQKIIKYREHRRKYKERNHGTRNVYSRQNISSQSRSSQSFKNIQVSHILKRCFCTLKFLQKKKPKDTHVVSRKTMASLRIKELGITARKRQTQTKSPGIKYVMTPVTSAPGTLLPYECEPYFCIPGECNPYECAERIRARNQKVTRRFSKDTNTIVTKKKSMSAFTSQPSTKSLSKRIQYRENKNKKQKSRHSYSSKEGSKGSSGKTDQQAVRIGSSFTFNIEFSKRKKNQLNADEKETAKIVKKEKKHLQHQGIKVYKSRIHHEISGTNKFVKSKRTHTEPFLQKCLCTLKLRKKIKNKVETAPFRSNAYIMHMQNKSITANRADTDYNHDRSNIQPYEYMCLLDESNPYKCEKLLQLREINLQNKYSTMADLESRSTLSDMSRTINSFKTQYPPSNIRDSNKINIISSRSKQQSVRVGSTLSFNIEYLKEKSPNRSKIREKATKVKKHDHKKYKLETKGSQDFTQAHQRAIDSEDKRKEKGSHIGTALKRCFCTFKFLRNKTYTKPQSLIYRSTKASYPLPNPQKCEFKGTKTSNQLILPQICERINSSSKISKPLCDFKSGEFAPNYFAPGMCDAYDCHEGRRKIKRSHDRFVNTVRHKRKSVKSATNSQFSGSLKSRSTQSRLLQHTSTKEKKMRVSQKDIRPKRLFSPSHQVARIGSKFSLKVVSSIHNTVNSIRGGQYNSESKASTGNKRNDKRLPLKPGISPSKSNRKENKVSNVGYLLKRCFCTLGLQKKNTVPKTQMLKSELRKNQPLTTQFVHILQSNENKKKYIAKNMTKLNCSALDDYRYGGVPLELKLPRDPFKQYIFGHQNGTKNINYGPHHLEKNSSFAKRLRSGINLNFNEYQVGYLINTQKLSPFYQSFYALNLKVSKLKNIPKNTHVLEDNECEPGFCIPYDCDPVECLKRINSRLKSSKYSETDRLESKSVECYEKNKEFKYKAVGAHALSTKARYGKHRGTPTIVGSDLSINIGIYKDTDGHRTDVIMKPTKPYSRNKKTYKENATLLETCLCPMGKKTSQPSRHAIRVGSDLQVAMSFYKEKKTRSDGVTSTLSKKPRHSKGVASQSTQCKSKATCISQLLSRCFCTSKLINETYEEKNRNKKKIKPEKSKKGSKPDKNKNIPEADKKTKQTKKPEKVKKNTVSEKSQINREKKKKNSKDCKCEGTHPKYKSTASLMSRKSIKSRSVQSKGKNWSSCSNYCVQKKRRHRDNSPRQSHNVTFGSNIHFDMEFFKDRSQGKGDQMRSGPISCKCKKPKEKKSKGRKLEEDQEYSESILHPDQCETNACIPNKCSPIKCEKRINKRRVRSKNTKVKKDIITSSVKSVATDTGITKSKGRPKSFKECHPHDCEKKISELGMIQPNSSRKSKKKGKLTSSSMQKDDDKLIVTNKQNTSVLKCFSVLTQRTSKQPATIQQREKGTGMSKKSNLNNFIEKCYCTLKLLKGGKQLTPKRSIERIVNGKKTGKLQVAVSPKPYIKLEKKVKNMLTATPEMKTIMPYSKKKFTKLESETKFKQGATNTTDPCFCATTKSDFAKSKRKEGTIVFGKGSIKSYNQNVAKVVMFCPVCKNVSKPQKVKQSLNTCLCPDENHTCLCFEGVGDGKKQFKKDQKDLCPVCLAKAGGKYNKKARKTKLCTCMGDGNQVAGDGHTCGCPFQMPQNDLCPICNKKDLMMRTKQSKKKGKEVTLPEDEQCEKSVCPCCKRVFSLETCKNIKESIKSKIFSMCSFFTGNKTKEKRIKPVKPIKNIDSDPLFELLVNKNNMNILNRDEVLKNLGSSGKESRAMKKARKAIRKGELSPPLMEMIIDRKSASIVNKDEILHQMNNPRRGKAGRKTQKSAIKQAQAQNLQPPEPDQKKKSQAKSEPKTSSKSHGSKCKCCVCTKYRNKGGAKFNMKPRKLKPCICGSVICKKDWEKLKKEERSIKSLKIKPCVCGSDICREESQKMPDLLLEAARQAQQDKEQAKQDIINEKIYQKERLKRKKLYAKEDKKLWKMRRKEDKREMKLVKKYDTAPDVLMVAESLIDFGSFGAKAFCDVMRSAGRVAKHPRDGVYHVKDAMRDPNRAAKEIKQSIKGMGLYSTLARVRRRMLKMPITRNAIAKLESYPVSNYLVHIADRDPKQRMKKFKNKRLREPIDFECSLFMASLRKRPCMRVYYMCPWFYPHCVGLLAVWKQFTDILLFILAVGVWSPCILCMELCRAMVCCCLCTG